MPNQLASERDNGPHDTRPARDAEVTDPRTRQTGKEAQPLVETPIDTIAETRKPVDHLTGSPSLPMKKWGHLGSTSTLSLKDDADAGSFDDGASSDYAQTISTMPTTIRSSKTEGRYQDPGGYRQGADSSSSMGELYHGLGSAYSSAGPSRWAPDLLHLSSPAEGWELPSGPVVDLDAGESRHFNGKVTASPFPPYLKPELGEGYLRLDSDGVVMSGTLEALVERLTVDTLSKSDLRGPVSSRH